MSIAWKEGTLRVLKYRDLEKNEENLIMHTYFSFSSATRTLLISISSSMAGSQSQPQSHFKKLNCHKATAQTPLWELPSPHRTKKETIGWAAALGPERNSSSERRLGSTSRSYSRHQGLLYHMGAVI